MIITGLTLSQKIADGLILFLTARTLSREYILSAVAQSKKLKQVVDNLLFRKGGRFKEDLLQELYLHLAELPEQKLFDMYHRQFVIYYSISFLTTQGKSPRSPFNYKHTKFYSRNTLIEDYKDFCPDLKNDFSLSAKDQRLRNIIPFINQQIDGMETFEKLVMDLYYNHGFSLEKIARELGVSKSGVKYTRDMCLAEIKARMIQDGWMDEIDDFLDGFFSPATD